MQVSEIMTRPVITVRHDASLYEAVQLMLANRISGLPVVDDAGHPIGMLTEADLLRRAETQTDRRRPRWVEFLIGPGRLAQEYVHAHSRRAKDVMTPAVIAVSPEAPLDEAVRLMERKHIKRILVQEGNRPVGMVTRANLLQALAAFAPHIPPSNQSDMDIRQRVLAELDQSGWANRNQLNVIVRDGVVHLHGIVTDAAEGDALRVAAENVPGVKAVHSRLEWCDLASATVIALPEENTTAPTKTLPP